GVENNISINYYFGFVIQMILASGLIFEMPVLSYFLGRIGLLTPAFMRHYRRYALVGIMILAALLTPPDPLSQLLLAIPLLILYEISIYISGIASRKHRIGT
ncbi:MAG: twin-arginine translocase subunit TatC, partial [Candidatus Marinimicrobia bacterium]|nr:twin-arginine translocase subunit TatC [Candidatus Neomarinimicrobiota bacterium]